MSKIILFTAAILGAAAVGLGAFGAHSLEALLIENGKVSTFETASDYHFYHVIALLFIGYLIRRYDSQTLKTSAIAMIIGILLFSGSLYTLSLSNISAFGVITPIGGLFFILGWVLLSVSVFRKL